MCTLSNVKSLGAEMDPAREYLCSTDEPMFSQTSGLDKDAKGGGRDERREVLGNYPIIPIPGRKILWFIHLGTGFEKDEELIFLIVSPNFQESFF